MWTATPASASGVREADPERDHAHVLEARVGEQALPGQRPPEERHRDGERDEPEGDQDARSRVSLADDRRERLLRRARRRAARPAAAPPRAAPRPAAAPPSARRAASCAPAPSRSSPRARRAAARRRRARSSPPAASAASACQTSAVEPAAGRSRREQDDPEQRDAEAERGQDQVLPARLERARLPLKPTSSAEAAVVASTSSQAAPRLPASGTASSIAQKAKSAA